MSTARGRLFGVGVGPGDPELMTIKALRVLQAAPVVAYFVAKGKKGNAYGIVEAHLQDGQTQLPLVYPVTTEALPPPLCYETVIADFYDTAAGIVAAHLDAGRDVAVICEGDPFFYGSAMYLFDRLAAAFPSEVTPGITGMSGCWAQARLPMTHGDDILTVLPGTLDQASLAARLAGSDASVIMKVGRNMPKIRAALEQAGLTDRALYVERGTMAGTRAVRLADLGDERAPYFSLVLVPGRQRPR